MTRDAIFGTFAFVGIVAFLGVEFLGLILWLRKAAHKLGILPSDLEHESVDVTVRRMDDWPYAATRNASQHRNGGHDGRQS